MFSLDYVVGALLGIATGVIFTLIALDKVPVDPKQISQKLRSMLRRE